MSGWDPRFVATLRLGAETFATLSQLYPGRVFPGLESGEALNQPAATVTFALAPLLESAGRSAIGRLCCS